MRSLPLLVALPMLAACATLSSPTTRAQAHELRVQIEAEFRAVQAETQDPELLAKINKVALRADQVGELWDDYLARSDEHGRLEVIGGLNLLVDAATDLLPELTGDAEKARLIRAGLASVRILLIQFGEDVGSEAVIGKAEALPEAA